MRSRRLLLGLPATLTRGANRIVLAALLVGLAVPGAPAAGSAAGVRDGGQPEPPVQPPALPLPAPAGTTSLVSVRVGGGFAGGPSAEPSISENGRFVAFTSRAPDLVTGDTNDALDVFVRDTQRGTTVRAVLPGGLPVPPRAGATQPAISANGRVVAFTYQPPPTASGGLPGPFVIAWDRVSGVAEYVSRGVRGLPAGGSSDPTISADGRYVAYVSTSSTIVLGDDNGSSDVFRLDRETGRTVLVSAAPDGTVASGASTAPSISRDGGLVAFTSTAASSLLSGPAVPTPPPALFVPIPPTGLGTQVYLRDVDAGFTEQISVTESGAPPDGVADSPAISADGRYVAFESLATNLVASDGNGASDVFRRDRGTATTTLVSVNPDGGSPKGPSGQPAISASGRVVAFTSGAPDVLPAAATGASSPPPVSLAALVVVRGSSEVYARDMDAGETIRISEAATGGPGGSSSITPAIGAEGRFVAFTSLSPQLVNGDTNKLDDVFLRDLPPDPRVNPPVLEFGTHPIDVAAPPAAAILSNAGWGPLAVTGSTITGGAAGDYEVVVDSCAGALLHRGEACTVSVLFTPGATGSRTAVLEVADRFDGSPRTVRLRGAGSLAQLEIDPDVGPPGIVAVVTGTGFPAGAEISLAWTAGITPHLQPIVADEAGGFRVQVIVFHNDRVGPRDLVATSVAGEPFPSTQARMLVTAPSVAPPGFLLGRFIDLPVSLLIRG